MKNHKPGAMPRIITLCGSTRFKREFEHVQALLTLEGNIVISVGLFGHSGDLPKHLLERGNRVKDELDELHFRKIDLADEIFVIDPEGYIGVSTSREIDYARENKKWERRYSTEPKYWVGEDREMQKL